MSSASGHAPPAGPPPAITATDPPGSSPPGTAGPPRAYGLRERKKAKTRSAIRRHAFRLFREQGYYATTIEQIAEAAEVSPSTFFRYFPTKEDVVLQDDVDLLALEAFEAQPPGLSPIAALRAAMRETYARLSAAEREQFHEATALSMAVNEIRSRAFDEFGHGIQIIAEAIARRVGRDPNHFAIRNLASAIVGVVVFATLTAAQDPAADILELTDSALANLDAGLPL